METNEITPKPKKRKAKPAPKENGHRNGQHHEERAPERDTRPIAEVRSGNVMARVWANKNLVGSPFSYRFRFSRVSDYQKAYFDGDDGNDAVIAAKMVKRVILRHRWKALFRFRK